MCGQDERKKEEGHMEAINKPQESMVVTQGMTKAFIDVLASQNHSKTYWDECVSTKKSVPSSVMDKLKEMCNGEE
jgi:hypothetical protein